jgi:hypothetical protein
MTLRDCTLFVQIPRELFSCSESVEEVNGENLECNGSTKHFGNHSKKSPRPIKVVIADVDEKSEEARGHYWKSVEQSLITGGYYLGEGKLDLSTNDCDLSDDMAWLTLLEETGKKDRG